jgi:hypothetical protein
VFRSVKDLETAIREFIEVHNEDPTPFVWTRTADQIPSQHRSLRTANPRRSLTRIYRTNHGDRRLAARV